LLSGVFFYRTGTPFGEHWFFDFQSQILGAVSSLVPIQIYFYKIQAKTLRTTVLGSKDNCSSN
jgi:hypothetical protein